MNRNNANRKPDLRNKILAKRASADLRYELSHRRWSPYKLAGFISDFILDPDQ